MNNYELTISPNYVNNWGVREAIRELLQNAIDGEKCGYEKSIEYKNDTLIIHNDEIVLSPKSLILGGNSKEERDDLIGGYHEGMKLALLVLLRKGFIIRIENGGKIWTPKFIISEKFDTQVLNIEETNNNDVVEKNGLTFYIYGITNDVYNDLYSYFPCIDNEYGETINCNNGTILLDKKFKGKMFVEGLYIQTDNNFQYGYNFNCNAVKLDRDRKAINYYELRKLTAESVVSAENCHPLLFKAISDSVNDIKDILEVIDEANDNFLQSYRDMLYEEKNLEEDTIIATESVMKQISQMSLDVNVEKGTEIESYLIAKANDKLGIIEKAKEMIREKTDLEECFDSLYDSQYAKIMNWLFKQKNISKKRKDELIHICSTYPLSNNNKAIALRYIDFETFDFEDDSIMKLKEKVVLENEE